MLKRVAARTLRAMANSCLQKFTRVLDGPLATVIRRTLWLTFGETMSQYLLLDHDDRVFAGFRPEAPTEEQKDDPKHVPRLNAIFRKSTLGAPVQVLMLDKDDAIKIAANLAEVGVTCRYKEVK
jgi:hypothetical protein